MRTSSFSRGRYFRSLRAATRSRRASSLRNKNQPVMTNSKRTLDLIKCLRSPEARLTYAESIVSGGDIYSILSERRGGRTGRSFLLYPEPEDRRHLCDHRAALLPYPQSVLVRQLPGVLWVCDPEYWRAGVPRQDCRLWRRHHQGSRSSSGTCASTTTSSRRGSCTLTPVFSFPTMASHIYVVADRTDFVQYAPLCRQPGAATPLEFHAPRAGRSCATGRSSASACTTRTSFSGPFWAMGTNCDTLDDLDRDCSGPEGALP